MNKTLKVCIVQTSLFWEDVDKNLTSLEDKLMKIKGTPDIVVLPEMFASGFSMKGKDKIAQRYEDILLWMKDIANKKDISIVGSTPYKGGDKYYNRFLFVSPNGNVSCYDKKHLFTMGEESDHFSSGSDQVTIRYKGWNIRPFICYDLRFPVWCRNTKEDTYDVAIYVANWPSARSDAWLSLLKSRAIENQAFVIGVNCVGEDGMNLNYSGDSTVFDAKGKQVCVCGPFEEEIKTVELVYEELQEFRERFPVLNDADIFNII